MLSAKEWITSKQFIERYREGYLGVSESRWELSG
jgi:hypothetical protein